MNRREFLATAAGLALAGARPLRGDEAAWEKSFTAMDTWFWREKDLEIPAQVELLKSLGYSGMPLSWGQKHAERLQALRERKMEMPGLFAVGDVDAPAPGPLQGAVEFLRGSGSHLWLALASRKHARSDADGDESAAAFVSAMADACKSAGLPGVALYPHGGLWMEKVHDAVRLADLLQRRDVGVIFNQYHWMATEPGTSPRKRLEEAAPHLKAVTLNGSAAKASILPLGEGDYDVTPILRVLIELRYAGPISHQGFGIQGRLAERLGAAMKAWQELKKKAREPLPEAARAHLFISGIVQGVSFRASTQTEARKLGVKGWVRNLADGRVEAVLQGPREPVDELIRWCHRGPPAARVEKVEVAWEKAGEEFTDFDVKP
jgi:acylphosphatase